MTDKLDHPFTFEELSAEEQAERAKLYTHPSSVLIDVVRVMPTNVIMPKGICQLAGQIYNFELRPDDIFIITYPKTGTTMTQELVWQIMHGYDADNQIPLAMRSPFLEISAIVKSSSNPAPAIEDKRYLELMVDSVGYTNRLPKTEPRFIKSHLQLAMLPPDLLEKCPVIVVVRNPKDTAVSFYHHEKLIPYHGVKEDSFEEFVQLFMKGEIIFGDFWAYYKPLWELRNHKNMLFLFYEDIVGNFKDAIDKVATFLGIDFPANKVELLLHHMAFDNFKNNDAVNQKPPKGFVPDHVRDNFTFLRKGKVGDWKQHFSKELNQQFDKWIAENSVDTDLKFKYEV